MMAIIVHKIAELNKNITLIVCRRTVCYMCTYICCRTVPVSTGYLMRVHNTTLLDTRARLFCFNTFVNKWGLSY